MQRASIPREGVFNSRGFCSSVAEVRQPLVLGTRLSLSPLPVFWVDGFLLGVRTVPLVRLPCCSLRRMGFKQMRGSPVLGRSLSGYMDTGSGPRRGVTCHI